MPTKRQAADRVRQSNEQSNLWVRTPYWTPEVEEAYETWASSSDVPDAWTLVLRYVAAGVGVTVRTFNGSYCVTLRHDARIADGLPGLLSGWSDDAEDALHVVTYKLDVMLGGDWATEVEMPNPRRRR